MLNPDKIDEDRVLHSRLSVYNETLSRHSPEVDSSDVVTCVEQRVAELEKTLDAVLIVNTEFSGYDTTDIVVHAILPAYASPEQAKELLSRSMEKLHHDLMSGNIGIEEGEDQ